LELRRLSDVDDWIIIVERQGLFESVRDVVAGCGCGVEEGTWVSSLG